MDTKGLSEECSFCKGAGVLKEPYQKIVCPDCDGKGWLDSPVVVTRTSEKIMSMPLRKLAEAFEEIDKENP